MTDLRTDMTRYIESTAEQLSHVRGCRPVDALVSVGQSFAENLRDSRGTSMESYWQAMSDLADGMVAEATGSR